MPGVLQIEALAQTGGILAINALPLVIMTPIS
jgi:3-hydroxymyristoyl/3-hydroxydecanoyl-(acyl carrier protein) dehydratase